MKNICIICCLALLCYIMSSCTTSQTITVHGTPGTEIYAPTMQKLAVVQNNGQADIKFQCDGYYAYLLSKRPDAEQLVPFALDYKKRNVTGTNIAKAGGYALSFAGSTVGLVGGIGLASARDGDNTYLIPTIVGFGATFAGLAIGMPADFRMDQTQYEYRFKYLPSQITNEDIVFNPIVDNGIRKMETIPQKETELSNDKTVPASTTYSTAWGKSTASKRTIKDAAKLLAGTYIGGGVLGKSDNVVEKYDKVSVVLRRIDKNKVVVEVIESGEPFFNSETEYTIKKEGDKYVLSLSGIPSAYIKIASDGSLAYYHPKVNIDGEMYVLEVSAKKTKK